MFYFQKGAVLRGKFFTILAIMATGKAPIITLTTDFGLTDHYVGTMKGVILSRCPNVTVVDITHGIPPFELYAGGYAIAQAVKYFPAETIHVVVVDPGVGTARKPILASACGQVFIAPDNGVLSLIYEADPSVEVREITNHELWLENPSNTFHGRDVFAPAASAIACNRTEIEQAGPVLREFEKLPDIVAEQIAPGIWRGRILSVDRFGNVITNFPPVPGARFELLSGNVPVTDFRLTFSGAPEGACFWYLGSSEYLEIGINQGHAASRLGLSHGASIMMRVTIG